MTTNKPSAEALALAQKIADLNVGSLRGMAIVNAAKFIDQHTAAAQAADKATIARLTEALQVCCGYLMHKRDNGILPLAPVNAVIKSVEAALDAADAKGGAE